MVELSASPIFEDCSVVTVTVPPRMVTGSLAQDVFRLHTAYFLSLQICIYSQQYAFGDIHI